MAHILGPQMSYVGTLKSMEASGGSFPWRKPSCKGTHLVTARLKSLSNQYIQKPSTLNPKPLNPIPNNLQGPTRLKTATSQRSVGMKSAIHCCRPDRFRV